MILVIAFEQKPHKVPVIYNQGLLDIQMYAKMGTYKNITQIFQICRISKSQIRTSFHSLIISV